MNLSVGKKLFDDWGYTLSAFFLLIITTFCFISDEIYINLCNLYLYAWMRLLSPEKNVYPRITGMLQNSS